MSFWLYQGDCRQVLKGFPAESVDAVVTDPPYELGMMNKSWDKAGVAFEVETWVEVLRMMRPGAYLAAFGGTRTYHRLTCAIEDAGFEIRDCVTFFWLHGQGFPKSLNLGGGYGTALKPAFEPIVLARKAPIGNIASNIAVHGVGALNIDAARVVVDEAYAKNCSGDRGHEANQAGDMGFHMGGGSASQIGRWPANVVMDEGAGALLDEEVGPLKAGGSIGAHTAAAAARTGSVAAGDHLAPRGEWAAHDNGGGPSRYFYQAKTTRAERDFGCEHLPIHSDGEATDREDGSAGTKSPRAGAGRTGGVRNRHPTLKPVSLLRWLTRLISPPGGMVLDPFCGSGSGGMAARLEGMGYMGIDLSAEYLTYAHARISAVEQGRWRENA